MREENKNNIDYKRIKITNHSLFVNKILIY